MNLIAKDIFNSLAGRWDFQRNITEAALAYHIFGSAEFSLRRKDVLRYQETGIFEINNISHNFFRNYEYVLQTDDNVIPVYFVENDHRANLFHAINLDICDEEFIAANAEHLCINDQYKVQYKFFRNNDEKFEIRYEVKGPAKDYVIVTTYLRRI
jgi:hypothetical protein